MSNILIVEDDEKLRNELECFLKNSGYNVKTLNNFNNTINDIISCNSDLILLDVNIPNLNGEIVCREVRKSISTPIIIVTSRNTEFDELISINYGADDFITKPFNTQILLARMERLINRINNQDKNIKYNDLILDVSKSCIIKDSKVIDISKNEFKIFCYFLNNRGKIVSRNDLIDHLWDNDNFVDDNTLTVNVNRLRNRLSSLGYDNVINTKRGQGYLLL